MPTTATKRTAEVYVTAVQAGEVFADPTYQRAVDQARIKKMAATWDRRLVGMLELSDRGEAATPRFAVVDGQHRWAAAKLLDIPPALVANIHTGLTIAEEAALFDKLNRQRKQTNTWDHWKARRAAGDPQVFAIEKIVRKHDLAVDNSPADGRIACVAALEKVVKLGGPELLNETLSLIAELWGSRRDALDSQIIHGVALVLHYLADALDYTRLGDALLEVMPRQLRAQATALKDMYPGSAAVLTAIAIVSLYNKRPGRRILVSSKTFSGAKRGPKVVA